MFTLIVNPTSGGKRAYKNLPKVINELETRQIEYRMMRTIYPPKPEHYKDVPCGKDDTVCVIGGDGTMLDIMNMLPGHDMTLMYVPCGTGNDFIKCVRLPKKPIEALKCQLDGTKRHIDFAYANDECFMNVFGTGFDVETLKKLDMFKIRFSGLKAYIRAVRSAVKEYAPQTVLVSVDGGEFVEKDITIFSVGNGQFIGGGMKAVPDADPFDGKFSVVECKPVTKKSLLILLPLFIWGKHTKSSLATSYTCESLVIKRKDGTPLTFQIDGEIRDAEQVSLSISHNKLLFSL